MSKVELEPFGGAQAQFFSFDDVVRFGNATYIVGGCSPTGMTIVPYMSTIKDLTFEISDKQREQIKKLTAQYNRARATRNKHLEKELLLKIKELGG